MQTRVKRGDADDPESGGRQGSAVRDHWHKGKRNDEGEH